MIWRDAAALPDDLVFKVDYLGGQVGTFAINFSRPAGQVIAQYFQFLRLGREGYAKVQMAAYNVAQYLAREIAPLGPYEFICTGSEKTGIPAICFKIKDGADPGYTLYAVSDRLRMRGWQVPAFALAGGASDISVMRVMCRRGFDMDMASLFVADFKAALAFLGKHGAPKLTAADGTSYHHT